MNAHRNRRRQIDMNEGENKDYWADLLELVLPYLEEKGKMSELARYIGVPRQHVYKWVREGLSPNFNNGKIIELWVSKQ